jgi:hypothetical protein
MIARGSVIPARWRDPISHVPEIVHIDSWVGGRRLACGDRRSRATPPSRLWRLGLAVTIGWRKGFKDLRTLLRSGVMWASLEKPGMAGAPG